VLPDRAVSLTPPALAGIGAAGPVLLERWFAGHGAPPPLDLARSGAAALSVSDVLRVAPPDALDSLLRLSLDYGDGSGSEMLRTAVAIAGSARHAGEVLVTNGAVEALLLACAALVGPRRRVLVGVPAYEALRRAPAAAGAEVVAVPVWRSEGNRIDLAPLLDRLDHRVAAVLVNSPANPTGATASAQDLDGLAAHCAAAGAVLVVDEVAAGTLDPAARSVTAGAAYASGAVVAVGDASKALGLGGLRVGWLATASAPLRRAVASLKDLTTVGNAAPSELLGAWALQRRDVLLAGVRASANSNLGELSRWVAQRCDAWLPPPHDGLVAFPFLPQAATTRAAEQLRRRHGLAVVPGELFGVEGHVRLGLGLPAAVFAAALDRCGAALTPPAG
jgi:aspartate/methionine/tyrosine aminotransferase